MPLFMKNGVVCNVEHAEGESEEEFQMRGWFVVSQNPKTVNELNDYVKWSRIYLNLEHNGCEYSPHIMAKVEQMKQNM